MAELKELPPVLIFKCGVFGSTEVEFGAELARLIRAHHLSSDMIRLAQRARMPDGTPRKPIDTAVIAKIMKDVAHPILVAGNNLVADAFYNTANSRLKTPLTIARRAGAKTVALNIRTDYDLVRERVERWTANDTLGLPLSEWGEIRPMGGVNNSYKTLELADPKEDIDLVIDLDGGRPNEDLVYAVAFHLVNDGLIHAPRQ